MEDNLLENDRKRYADDITLQELVRLRVENERLREALVAVKDCFEDKNYIDAEMIIDNALQQKDSE